MNSSIIILAAGASERMGSPKPILSLGEQTFLERILATVKPLNAAEIIVVLGAHREQVEPVVRGYPWVRMVINPDYSRGQLSSIQEALRQMRPGRSFWVHLVDQPLVREETWRKLWVVEASVSGRLVVPVFAGREGHPVGIPFALKDEILALSGAPGLKQIFLSHSELVERVAVDDEGVRIDIDTPEQYQGLRNNGRIIH